jgi:hypothetical protein
MGYAVSGAWKSFIGSDGKFALGGTDAGTVNKIGLYWDGASNLSIKGNINASTITGGTVTGAVLQTIATANQGIKIDGTNGLGVFNNSGVQTLSATTAGVIDARGITIRDAAGNVMLASGDTGAIWSGKKTSSNISTYIADLAVGTAQISNAAITNAKINNLAVDNAKIANAAITNAKIDNLAVDAAKIANAAITTAKIGDLQVSTLKIEDNAVTVPVSAYTEGELTITGTNYVAVQSASIDSLGQPVQVIFTMLTTAWNDVGPVYDVAIFRDTTPILSANGISGYDIKTIALAMQDTPTSGTHTYSVKVRSGGTPTTIYPKNRSLLLLGVKK